MKIVTQVFTFLKFFLISLIIIEIFVRLVFVENVSLTEFYSDTGRGLRRNFEFVKFNEGFGIGKINEKGFLGNYYEKNEKTIRIALLGDSYVESYQVFERDHFGVKTVNRLKSNEPLIDFEYMNFGRSGFGFKNMYAYHKSFVDDFGPEIVLYMLADKDLFDESTDPFLPQVKLEENLLSVVLNTPEKELNRFQNTKFLTQNSVILNMLNFGRKKINNVPIGSILLDKLYFDFNDTIEKSVLDELYENQRLDQISVQIVQDLNPENVIFVNRGDNKLPKEFLKVIDEKGFDFIDLSIVLNEMKSNGIDPHYWNVTKKSGHWNQVAHTRLGNHLAEGIEIFLEKRKLNN